MSEAAALRPASRCVHGGAVGDGRVGPLVPPIVQSTTYGWASLEDPPPITYARSGNATVEALERRIASLEHGGSAICFGSGLAAIDALLRSLPPNARIVAGRHVYGGTTRLLGRFHGDRSEVELVDASSEPALRAALERPADLVLVETPSNPTLRITDLRRAAGLAHAAGALLAVDNTLLTPLYQRPLELGADLSIHSTTKYLDGHNATLGGALVLPEVHSAEGTGPDGRLGPRLRWVRKSTGAVLAPFEAWLTLQGSKTLHLRTQAQWSNAARVAEVASGHPAVAGVHYPGRPEHPGHDVHRAQATGDGGLVSLDLGSLGPARRFAARLRLISLAENLGATESIATHPASMTHSDLSPERRRSDGIGDGLVRLSLGVEDPDDLAADVRRALDAAADGTGGAA